jgi:hypothetical protein
MSQPRTLTIVPTVRYGRSAAALVVLSLAAAACAHGSAPAAQGSTGVALGAGPMPTLVAASGGQACMLPARVPTPSWVPADLPWPAGSYVSRDLRSGDSRAAQIVVPVSQQDLAAFIADRWPKAGYTLGDSDAEPGRELEQEFDKDGREGKIKAQVVGCDPGYQSVFLSLRSD